MDYSIINNLKKFLEYEIYNSWKPIPKEWDIMLQEMGIYSYNEDATYVKRNITNSVALISIRLHNSKHNHIQKAIINDIDKSGNNKKILGIFIFTGNNNKISFKDRIKEDEDFSINHNIDTNRNGLSLFLISWVKRIIEILDILGIELENYKLEPYQTTIQNYMQRNEIFLNKQLNLLPAYLITHMCPFINDYFKNTKIEDLCAIYDFQIHQFFPGEPMFNSNTRKYFVEKLVSIAKDEEPLLNL